MKKLLGIVVLGLLLTGCFNKKETALENCADDTYANYSKDSMTSVFYDKKSTKIVGLSKALESATIKKSAASKVYTEFVHKNYLFDGGILTIIYDRNKITSLEERQNYEKAIKAESEEFLKDNMYWLKEIGYLNKTLKEEKYFSASKLFMEALLKRKIKVNEYYKRFTECEKEYSEAPDAFLLRWKN